MLRKLQASQVARRALLFNTYKNSCKINAVAVVPTISQNFNKLFHQPTRAVATAVQAKYYSTVNNNSNNNNNEQQAAAESIEPEVMSEHVIEITSPDDFNKYIQLHANCAIILDCYADWCQPCKQLSPILDRLSKQYNGQVKIFKVNVDNVPDVAQQFQVEVLPTIFGIVKGNQLVVQDTGLKEEGFYKQMVEQMLQLQYQGLSEQEKQTMQTRQQNHSKPGGTPDEQFAAAKELMSHGQLEAASQTFNSLLEDEAAKHLHAKCYGALILMILGKGDVDTAGSLAAQLNDKFPKEARSDADVRQALAYYEMSKLYSGLEGNTQDVVAQKVKEAVQQNPQDITARSNLAIVLMTSGHPKEAIDLLFSILKTNSKEPNARKLLLLCFDVLGQAHELTIAGRKQLTRLLF